MHIFLVILSILLASTTASAATGEIFGKSETGNCYGNYEGPFRGWCVQLEYENGILKSAGLNFYMVELSVEAGTSFRIFYAKSEHDFDQPIAWIVNNANTFLPGRKEPAVIFMLSQEEKTFAVADDNETALIPTDDWTKKTIDNLIAGRSIQVMMKTMRAIRSGVLPTDGFDKAYGRIMEHIRHYKASSKN